MNVNHLRIFYAVAREESISRGAEQLYISQPAVSKQLQELEAALKTRLFDRLPRGVRRTEAGDLLFNHARRIFQAEADAERALLELQGLERGRLTIGASTTIGDYLMPGIMARFQGLFPGIELSMTVANTDVIQSRLLEGTLDLGFTEGFADNAAFASEIFMHDELVVIVAPHSALLREGEVTAARLCREPLILRELGSGTRSVIERAFLEKGLTMRAKISLGSSEAIKQCVMSGGGIGVVSKLTVLREVASDDLRILTVSDFKLRRPLHRLQLRDKHTSIAAKAFLETLSQQHHL